MKTKEINKKPMGEPTIKDVLYFHKNYENKICIVKANGVSKSKNNSTFEGICLLDQTGIEQAGQFSGNWDRKSFKKYTKVLPSWVKDLPCEPTVKKQVTEKVISIKAVQFAISRLENEMISYQHQVKRIINCNKGKSYEQQVYMGEEFINNIQKNIGDLRRLGKTLTQLAKQK